VGLMIRSTCAACGTVAHQIDGAMMAGYRPRCADCGRARLVSIEDIVEDETAPTDALADPAE
jgi:predicted  nucleic acid-binding Zn-ribbon protein